MLLRSGLLSLVFALDDTVFDLVYARRVPVRPLAVLRYTDAIMFRTLLLALGWLASVYEFRLVYARRVPIRPLAVIGCTGAVMLCTLLLALGWLASVYATAVAFYDCCLALDDWSSFVRLLS